MTLSRLSGGLLAATMALAGAAAQAQTSINLNSQPNEAGFPMWLAQKQGYFEENGLEVEITYFPNGGAALASGVSGQWQAGWTGGPPAISGWDKFQLITVGTMQKESRNLKVLVRNDVLEGKTEAEALTSTRIGTVPNSTWSQVLYACAAHFGIEDQGALDVVPLDPPVTRQSLLNGEIGAGTTAGGDDIGLVHDTEQFTMLCDGEMAGTAIIAPYIVTLQFWEDDPEAAASFVEAVYTANEWITANPEAVIDLVMEYYNDIGIDGTPEMVEYALDSRDFVSLDDAIADMESGATTEALTSAADVLVAGGARDDVPDFGPMQPIAVEILTAAKALRN